MPRDQRLLGDLRAKVPALRQALGADDRQGHVVTHAGGRFRGEEVPGRRLEELQDGVIVQGGRV